MIATSTVQTNGAGPVLSLHGIVKRFGRSAAPAVAGVSLELAAGEIAALVGESGCGKTTLLRLIAGLEMPDAGEVRVAGRRVCGSMWVPPEHRGVGMVFQDFALFPHMTVRENIVYGLASRPRAERRPRAEAMLEMVGLAGLGKRYPHQLSGGQQQRVALARALAPEPSLILLDEPFSNLDTALKRALREEVGDLLRRANTAALLVVHDVEDVLVLADRAAVMRAGRLVQNGDPGTLYRHPADEYVAQFFGETNVLPGHPCAGGFETELGMVACAAAATCSEAVRLCLRPEDLQFVNCALTGRPAVVRRVRTSGTRRRILVTLENGGSPGMTLLVDAGPESMLKEGDRVFVKPKPEAAHILDRSS